MIAIVRHVWIWVRAIFWGGVGACSALVVWKVAGYLIMIVVAPPTAIQLVFVGFFGAWVAMGCLIDGYAHSLLENEELVRQRPLILEAEVLGVN